VNLHLILREPDDVGVDLKPYRGRLESNKMETIYGWNEEQTFGFGSPVDDPDFDIISFACSEWGS
jgi:predicted transposase YdaD